MKKAFQGVKVLDLTHALAGALCAMYLGDFGADVIKVEPDNGDQSREWGPWSNNSSVYFATFNRNKRSICIDLKSSEGREIIMDLVRECDVVISNFKYGTMEKLGIGYEAMKAVNPGIIYGSVSGFGTDGPLRDDACYDVIAAARSGLLDKTGELDGPPIKAGFSLADNWTGINFLFGIGMALVNKQTTGKGCCLDLAVMDACTYLLEGPILDRAIGNPVVPRNGVHDPEVAPLGTFKAKDGYVAIGSSSDVHWQKFCDAMNVPHLKEDERFRTNDLRVANLNEFIIEVEKVTSTMGKMEIEKLLQSNRVAAGGVMSMAELLEDEHVKARELAPEVDHPVIGKFRTMGIPIKFNKTPGDVNQRPAPAIGEHTDEILREIGYTDDKIAEMMSKRVINSVQ